MTLTGLEFSAGTVAHHAEIGLVHRLPLHRSEAVEESLFNA